MRLTDYIQRQESIQDLCRGTEEEAGKNAFSARKVLENIQEMWRDSDVDLRSANRYHNDRNKVWLEENDWVYGMLTKAVRYAREDNPKTAGEVYENAIALQKKIEMRKMREEEYLKLKSMDAETMAKYLLKRR